MSADNVTSIRPTGGPQPPTKPPRKPRRAPKDRPDLSFSRGEGPTCCVEIFIGLKGVCEALNELDGVEAMDQFVRLSAAAVALVNMLDERMIY